MSDQLEQALVELAGDLRVDVPADLDVRVLAALPAVGTRNARRRWSRWWSGLLATLLGAGVVASPVGASVREWFSFHGVVIEDREPELTGEPSVPVEPTTVTLREAAALAGFVPLLPRELGEPDGVSVSQDHRVVSLSWGSGGGAVRLDQFDGSLEPAFWKTARDPELVTVSGTDALWFPTPHDLAVVADDGSRLVLPPRLAGRTLVWVDGGVTLRLEGALDRDRAVAIAESVG